MNRSLLAITAALFVQAAVAGPIYRWVDEDGVTHFAAQPPTDHEFVLVGESRPMVNLPPTAAPTDEAEPAAPPVLPELPTLTVTAPDPAVVAERCEQARQNLRHLSGNAPIILAGEDGSREALAPARRGELIAETRAFIDQWCR